MKTSNDPFVSKRAAEGLAAEVYIFLAAEMKTKEERF